MAQQHKGFFDWLSHHLFACPFKSQFGFDCPGCGLQRSGIALLQGNFVESFRLYPPTIFMVFLVLFTALHIQLDFKFGALIIKSTFIAIAVIIVINYIYKIYNHQLIS
ncbi:DUF2752 domain-containing protein [Pedobacter aquatilis]|uniref:DUF2752 domain-containing protein n=1 Tax=Pedobacter aquatilis TaxID=351343 RepID=UPI0025B3FD78|nr:DUF2752 domain-containing protein [Pedobacter aquatilis]MDN3585841.1 DUF2752 domain-containing protein [Pedobacter aquatilis]